MISFENTEIAFAGKSNKQLKKAYYLFKLISYNWMVSLGTPLLKFALAIHFPIKRLIKNTVFEHFCGGESITDSSKKIEELANYNVKTILDYSVEGKESTEDFESCKNEVIQTIIRAENTPNIPFCVFKVTGLGPFKVLEKASKTLVFEGEEWEKIEKRIFEICTTAFNKKVKVLIDAEETWIQPAIDHLAFKMMFHFNSEKAFIYNTVQLYRKIGLSYLKQLHIDLKAQQKFTGVKIVRGAYMEKERERAKEMGYESPIQTTKENTDSDFDKAIEYCVENIADIAVCCGSHNEKSSMYLAQLMLEKAINKNDDRVYFAQLLGMSDHISYNLAEAGFNVAKYVPYGPVREVMPYLIRRANENKSVAGQTGRELQLITREIKRRKLIKTSR